MCSSTRNLWVFLLLSLLLVGAGLRFTGLTRGSANLVLTGPPVAATPFYRFHPDEELVIRAALTPDLDPLNPPFTVYGLLPVYALRGALALADLCGWGGTSLEDPDSARHIYYVARTLAVLCSCGVLLLVWRMVCRYFSQPAATLGLAIIAFVPGYWLLARIHRQLGAPDSASEALVHYQLPGWGSASTSYLDIAKPFWARGDTTGMEQVVEVSTRIFGVKEAFNILALQAQKRGELEQALQWWEQSLLLDADQANIHQRAGLVALLNLGLREKAQYHLARAIALDPSLQEGIATALRAAGESR